MSNSMRDGVLKPVKAGVAGKWLMARPLVGGICKLY
jgi:hypothetical protein